MSVAELAPLVDALPRLEKFQLLQFLVSSITRDEQIEPIDPSVVYPVWSPYDVPQSTVNALVDLLPTEERNG